MQPTSTRGLKVTIGIPTSFRWRVPFYQCPPPRNSLKKALSAITQLRLPIRMFLHGVISLRLAGLHDPTKVFRVMEMLTIKGYQWQAWVAFTHPHDHNSSHILRSVLQQTPTICGNAFRKYLFTAICTFIWEL